MKYNLIISDKIDKLFSKLAKKDKEQLIKLHKKVEEIRKNPYHFKLLRGDMHGARRVHIGNSFVLIYEIDEQSKSIKLLDYDHHDAIYET